jgi:hypothetical protein
MHPVRRAFDRWKERQPETTGQRTIQRFAEALGYKQADTVHRILRNEVMPPLNRLERIAELAELPLGRVASYFAKNVRRDVA